MGGIWNVIDAEARTLASLSGSGKFDDCPVPQILVAGPYYGYMGADWNKGLNRITGLEDLDPFLPDEAVSGALKALSEEGITVLTGEKRVGGVKIGYLLFQTDNFGRVRTTYRNSGITLENRVKAEAYELLGLNSMKYEMMENGPEYTHYLSLSYALSEFIRVLVVTNGEIRPEKKAGSAPFPDRAIPCMKVALHCHEFGTFHAIARLKKLGVPVNTVATFHATLPGRTAGSGAITKLRNNDSTWPSGVSENLAALEALASCADVVTAVGESTRQEARLFYGINGIVVRNGISIDSERIDWGRKERCLEKIQVFLSEKLYTHYGGKKIEPEKIIPIFTISRIELENKGYPDLLDALVALEHIIKNSILEGHLEEGVRVVCFLVTAEGPKSNLPEGFPVNLPRDILVGSELRLQNMIEERGLACSRLARGRHYVAAVLYPQIISARAGGLEMEVGDFMAGCCAGIFPSRYDPFLLTGLEAGREVTPCVVSRICGFSDAVRTNESLIEGLGGVIIVDNIDLSYYEAVLEYALAMSYFIRNFIDDRVKYKLLCREAYLLAKDMGWEKPVRQYYELLVGARLSEQVGPESGKKS
ncbi:MAG: glycosyltransferase family 4 protein [Methanosarcinaceae archaeon]|nr:glycosyltransferase family 4 protein [Methanosarcinaceae archaeon]